MKNNENVEPEKYIDFAEWVEYMKQKEAELKDVSVADFCISEDKGNYKNTLIDKIILRLQYLFGIKDIKEINRMIGGKVLSDAFINEVLKEQVSQIMPCRIARKQEIIEKAEMELSEVKSTNDIKAIVKCNKTIEDAGYEIKIIEKDYFTDYYKVENVLLREKFSNIVFVEAEIFEFIVLNIDGRDVNLFRVDIDDTIKKEICDKIDYLNEAGIWNCSEKELYDIKSKLMRPKEYHKMKMMHVMVDMLEEMSDMDIIEEMDEADLKKIHNMSKKVKDIYEKYMEKNVEILEKKIGMCIEENS